MLIGGAIDLDRRIERRALIITNVLSTGLGHHECTGSSILQLALFTFAAGTPASFRAIHRRWKPLPTSIEGEAISELGGVERRTCRSFLVNGRHCTSGIHVGWAVCGLDKRRVAPCPSPRWAIPVATGVARPSPPPAYLGYRARWSGGLQLAGSLNVEAAQDLAGHLHASVPPPSHDDTAG